LQVHGLALPFQGKNRFVLCPALDFLRCPGNQGVELWIFRGVFHIYIHRKPRQQGLRDLHPADGFAKTVERASAGVPGLREKDPAAPM